MECIETVLMRRDGLTAEEAREQIQEAAQEEAEAILQGGAYDEDMCERHFGLEPDYLIEFLGYVEREL